MVVAGRVLKFLAGLNIEYDDVRGGIIGRNPLPPIGKEFAGVWREESHRHVMLGKKAGSTTGSVEWSALVSCRMSQNQHARNRNSLCNGYCGKPSHTRENCYKFYGRPSNERANNSEQSTPAANEAE